MIPTEQLTSDLHGASRDKRSGVTIPIIWVAVVLSLLVHVAALWQLLPRLRLLPPEKSELSEITGPLTVHLAPLPSPPPSLALSRALRALPSPGAARPQSPRLRPAAPVVALTRPAADSPAPSPAAIATIPAPPAMAGDMASYIESRRRARGAMDPALAPPVEDDNARSNRIVAANLAPRSSMIFGYDPAQGGGVFQIERIGDDDAEFLFFGWNKDIRRKTKQMIEVRKGGNSDIRIAVVRRMIAIIREHEQGDFLWESQRLSRDVTLSARARDNAGLEDFMMTEFFPGARLSR